MTAHARLYLAAILFFLLAPIAHAQAFQCFLPADDGSDGLALPYWFEFYHDGDRPAVMLGRLGHEDLEISNCKLVYSEEASLKIHLVCYGEEAGRPLTVRLSETGFTQAFYAVIKEEGNLGVPCQASKDTVFNYLYGE